MTGIDNHPSGHRAVPWRAIGWGGAALLLLFPFLANAPWTSGDFIFAGVMLAVVGLVIELAVRSSRSLAYRVGTAVAVAAAILLVVVNGAVGFLGDENNPANAIFFGVIGIALLGSLIARFRAAGMARAMLAAAAAQLLAGSVGLGFGLGAPGGAGIYEAAVGTTLFTTLWLIAAALFRKAAREQASAAAAA